MAGYFEFNGDLDFQPLGGPVSVPNNDIAKCMYYLHCVTTVIDYDDDDMERYTDYENYRWLTPSERQRVFLLCKLLSPDEFEDEIFFENDAMCGNRSSNKFYEVSQVRHRLLAAHAIVIAGQTRQVKKIMAYKQSWMQYYYYEPMERLEYEINQIRRQQVAERILSDVCAIS